MFLAEVEPGLATHAVYFDAAGNVHNGSGYVAWDASINGAAYGPFRRPTIEPSPGQIHSQADAPAGWSRYRVVADFDATGMTAAEVKAAHYANTEYYGPDPLSPSEIAAARPISGAYAYTVLVTSDGTTPLANVRVRLTGGAYTDAVTTGIDGTVSFSVDAGSYTLSATHGTLGYGYTPEAVVIAGTASKTITMVAREIPAPGTSDQTVGVLTTFDGRGNAAAGELVTFHLVTTTDADATSFDRRNFDVRSDADGLLTVPLLKSSTYRARRGLTKTANNSTQRELAADAWVEFTTSTGDTFDLPQVLSYVEQEFKDAGQ